MDSLEGYRISMNDRSEALLQIENFVKNNQWAHFDFAREGSLNFEDALQLMSSADPKITKFVLPNQTSNEDATLIPEYRELLKNAPPHIKFQVKFILGRANNIFVFIKDIIDEYLNANTSLSSETKNRIYQKVREQIPRQFDSGIIFERYEKIQRAHGLHELDVEAKTVIVRQSHNEIQRVFPLFE